MVPALAEEMCLPSGVPSHRYPVQLLSPPPPPNSPTGQSLIRVLFRSSSASFSLSHLLQIQGTEGVIKWPLSSLPNNPGNLLPGSKHHQLSLFGKDFRTLQNSAVVCEPSGPVGA